MAVAAIHVVPDDNFDDWSFVTTRGTSSVTIQPGKPNLRRNQLGGSLKPGSSSISGREKEFHNLAKGWLARLFGS
jgi:hypothetical protein